MNLQQLHNALSTTVQLDLHFIMKHTIFIISVFLVSDVVLGRRRDNQPRVNPNCECGIFGEGISNRIVGGKVVIPHIFPWVVAIFHRGKLHCGGALINNRYILTAGHCVRWIPNQRKIEIGLGMHDIQDRKTGVIVPVDKVILHENFKSDYLHDTDDIALIKLKEPVEYTMKVQPICLPAKGSRYAGHNAKVAGWGRVKTGGGASTLLQEATLKVMTYAQCRNTSLGPHLTESMMCAYNNGTDACQGDSGGPLLFQRHDTKYETIGIVSWGIGCAKPGMPGVYVKLTDYIDWIKLHTKDAIYCIDS